MITFYRDGEVQHPYPVTIVSMSFLGHTRAQQLGTPDTDVVVGHPRGRPMAGGSTVGYWGLICSAGAADLKV